jgi:hypothetical protein
MNLRLGAALLVVAAMGTLAACSGGGGAAVPSGTLSVPRPQGIPVIINTPTPAPVATPSPTPVAVTGTLYYASATTAYAIPLSASGATTASRTIQPHADQSMIVAGIATEADGTLVVLQNYWDASQVQHCQATVEPADAVSATTPIRTIGCSADTANLQSGAGIARNKQGGFDLFWGGTQQAGEFVQRYASDGASLVNTMPIPDAPWWDSTMASATFAAGHDYMAATGAGHLRKYLASDTSESSAESDCVDGSAHGLLVATAVAPDGTLYVVRKTDPNHPTTNTYIDAITACPGGGAAATVSRTIGPFGQSFPTAMTVDSEGDLYVALEPIAGGAAVINVYGRWANDSADGKKPPTMRVINPSPTVYEIRNMTLYDTTGAAAF